MSTSTSSTSESASAGVADARSSGPDLVALVAPGIEVARDELYRLIDPRSAEGTVHWGRNYLYRARLEGAGGARAVVVKTFPGGGWRRRLQRRRKGSRARRSFDAALALGAAGVPTPAPVAALESADPAGATHFVCEHLEDALEARYLFRAMNEGRAGERFPAIEPERVLAALGATLRRLHEARLWHRDVSAGNVLLVGEWRAGGKGEVHLVDLARTRIGKPLTRSERMRDLARLPLHRPEHRRLLLESYEGRSPVALDRLLLAVHHHAFHLRHRAKDRLRGLRRWLRGLRSRGAHPHLPAPPEGALTRDRVVWDALSDQPHLYAGRAAKLRARLGDASVHGRQVALVARRLPAVVARYRELVRERHTRAIRAGEAGVGILGGSAPSELLVAELEALGLRRVLLRVQPWEDGLARDQALARALRGRGFDLMLAVAQSRGLVADPAQWRDVLEEIAERFAGLVEHVQIGVAINRSKWGIWNPDEYAALVATAAEVLGPEAGFRLVGPAVIDFEPYATCIALDWPANPVRFDTVSSLLYVDRRGAPERRQAGLDAVAKATLVRALIQTSRHGERESWITEVNWPLLEGPHSPAGRHVAVGVEAQADYLARYYLLLLGSGVVERVYWWQLVARGYGLSFLDGERLERRPSWRALRFVKQVLAESRALGPCPAPPPLRVHAFERPDGGRWLAAWSETDATVQWRPAATVRRVCDRDGVELSAPVAAGLRVGPSPVYFEIEGENPPEPVRGDLRD